MPLTAEEEKAIKHLQARQEALNKTVIDACTAEIDVVLKRHNCTLNPQFVIDAKGIHPPIILVQLLPKKD